MANAFAQKTKDLQKLENIHIFIPPDKPDYSRYKNQTGFFQVIFTQSFLFYKKFFSSQDVSSCPFSPSCSVYFISSIEKKGVLTGVLSGIDRYMRCNGKSNDKYKLDRETMHLSDPVE